MSLARFSGLMAAMSTTSHSLLALDTRCYQLQIERRPPLELPVRSQRIFKGVSGHGLSKCRLPLLGSSPTGSRTLQSVQFQRKTQGEHESRAVSIRCDTGEPSTSQELPSNHEEEQEYNEIENEPLDDEEESLPLGPAGGRQYDEMDPHEQVAEADSKEGVIVVEDAHLEQLPGGSTSDWERKQRTGWSESSCDEGSSFPSTSSFLDARNSWSLLAACEDSLIDRLLQTLPLYDRGRTPDHYRMRAVIYGKIGEYFTRDKRKARQRSVAKSHGNAVRGSVSEAFQQLYELILVDEGKSAADYNCRAEFFRSSAELFSFGDSRGENSFVTPPEHTDESCMEELLQEMDSIMLNDCGRSISDYSRRADMFGLTFEVVSARKNLGSSVAS